MATDFRLWVMQASDRAAEIAGLQRALLGAPSSPGSSDAGYTTCSRPSL
jgi:hypothetical protein